MKDYLDIKCEGYNMNKKYKSEKDLELNKEIKEDIKKVRKEFKNGKIHSLEKVKEKLGFQKNKMKELWDNSEDDEWDKV